MKRQNMNSLPSQSCKTLYATIMSHHLRIILGICFAGLLCMGLQCDKDHVENKYNFVADVDLFPAKKSYNVGDTIWIQYANPNEVLYDKITGNEIKADSVSVVFGASYNVRYGLQSLPVDGLCDFITPGGLNVGRLLGLGNGTGYSHTFGCSGSMSYDFRIGVIPKEPGIYSLDLLIENGIVNTCANRTMAFPPSTIGYRYNLADCNKDIYLTIPENARVESKKGNTETKIDGKEVYVIRVD